MSLQDRHSLGAYHTPSWLVNDIVETVFAPAIVRWDQGGERDPILLSSVSRHTRTPIEFQIQEMIYLVL
jgi:hypothetical protein